MINDIKEPWGESLLEEHNSLNLKLISLIDYLNSEEFHTLSSNTLKLLTNLKCLLETYIKAINSRLYENVDSIFIADYTSFALLLGAFNGFSSNSFSLPPLNSTLKLAEE